MYTGHSAQRCLKSNTPHISKIPDGLLLQIDELQTRIKSVNKLWVNFDLSDK